MFISFRIRFMIRRKRAKSKDSSGGGSRRHTGDYKNPLSAAGGLAGAGGLGAASVGGATSTGFDSHFVLEDDDGSDEGYFVGGGSGSSSSGAGGGGHHVSYYDNHLEILEDEED